jgi:3',5'-cyclic AMP phosphodiesterase CpdA
VTPGNHDLVAKRVYKPHYFHGLFGTDNGSILLGDLRLVFLNTAWGALPDEQFAWLEATLSAAHSGRTLVFCHKPLFDPREGQSYAIEHKPDAEKLHDMFCRHQVTAVFSGHIHTLLHSECDGIHYIISGGGGSKLKTDEDAHHYLWLSGNSESLMLEACVPQSGERLLKLNLTQRS